uniref:Uncharacterized protein n=1 Tax=Macrostomum lignano TaxID=282301 RepID=A0A1I8H6G1_9PLAT
MIMQKLFVLLCCILLVQLHFALGVSSDNTGSTDEDYCCLPMKWHAKNDEGQPSNFPTLPVLGNWTKASSNPPTVLDVFVNYRRPRFELRSSLASSLVFWRGHIQDSEALEPVPAGYHPSGGLAPLFFRCLARENGFERISPTHYRLDEREDSSRGRRFNVGSITDIHVVLSNGTTGGSSPRRRAKHTCLLASFTVTSRYFKHIDDGRSIALFKEADVYRPANGVPPSRRQGWPDRQFTEKARSFRDYYRLLLRSNRIQLNQPHLSLPVPGHLADLARNRAGNEDALASQGALQGQVANERHAAGRIRGAGVSQQAVDEMPSAGLPPAGRVPAALAAALPALRGADDVACQLESPLGRTRPARPASAESTCCSSDSVGVQVSALYSRTVSITAWNNARQGLGLQDCPHRTKGSRGKPAATPQILADAGNQTAEVDELLTTRKLCRLSISASAQNRCLDVVRHAASTTVFCVLTTRPTLAATATSMSSCRWAPSAVEDSRARSSA